MPKIKTDTLRKATEKLETQAVTPRTLYLGEYALERSEDDDGRERVYVIGSDDLPEALADDLLDEAMVFDGEVLNVQGWTEEQRRAENITDMECDEYWRGTMRLATAAEVTAVFFGRSLATPPLPVGVEEQIEDAIAEFEGALDARHAGEDDRVAECRQELKSAIRAVLAHLAAPPPVTGNCDCATGRVLHEKSCACFRPAVAPPSADVRDTLGRVVREAWVRWAQRQPDPKPHWLVPYDELDEASKEADRCIGVAVAVTVAKDLYAEGLSCGMTLAAQSSAPPTRASVEAAIKALKRCVVQQTESQHLGGDADMRRAQSTAAAEAALLALLAPASAPAASAPEAVAWPEVLEEDVAWVRYQSEGNRAVAAEPVEPSNVTREQAAAWADRFGRILAVLTHAQQARQEGRNDAAMSAALATAQRDGATVSSQETAEQTAFRHKACDALGLPHQTRFVTCAVHGQRGRVDDVYAMNNVCTEDHEVRCLPDHPFCFGYCSPDLQVPDDE